RQAEIHAQIRTVMPALRQFASEFPIAASQIEDAFIPLQRFEHPPHTGLNAMARGREGVAKTRIKIPIKFNEACGDGRIHGGIITGIIPPCLHRWRSTVSRTSSKQ